MKEGIKVEKFLQSCTVSVNNCVSCVCFYTEKAQANEQRYTKLKEKYTELVQSHADLLRKVRQTSLSSSSSSLRFLKKRLN